MGPFFNILLALGAASLANAQGQIVFPPVNGPCPQNAGQAPPSCDDTSVCTDIAAAGICHIQTQEGTPPSLATDLPLVPESSKILTVCLRFSHLRVLRGRDRELRLLRW